MWSLSRQVGETEHLGKAIERLVQNANDFRALIVHYLASHRIPEDWYCKASDIIWFRLEIEVADTGKVELWLRFAFRDLNIISGNVRMQIAYLIRRREMPSLFPHVVMNDADRYRIL